MREVGERLVQVVEGSYTSTSTARGRSRSTPRRAPSGGRCARARASRKARVRRGMRDIDLNLWSSAASWVTIMIIRPREEGEYRYLRLT